MAEPLVIRLYVVIGVLSFIFTGFVIWGSIHLYNHPEQPKCNDTPSSTSTSAATPSPSSNNCLKCNEAASTQFSLKAKLSIKKLEFNNSCLMSLKELDFLDTKISLDDSTPFKFNEAENCIKQKDFIDTDTYNLTVNVKKTDTNDSMKLMVTFDVAAAEQSVLKTNQLVFFSPTIESADLELNDQLGAAYKFNITNNGELQKKLDNLSKTSDKITLKLSDLNNTDSLVVTANNDVIFKKAIIPVCYLKTQNSPVLKETKLIYNKTDTTKKIFVETKASRCEIDTTYKINGTSDLYEMTEKGIITLKASKEAINATIPVVLTNIFGVKTETVTITVVA